MKKYDYSKENLSKFVQSSFSYSEVARKLGISAKGGNYETLRRKIKELDLDISHFLGKSWSRNKVLKKVPIEEYLSNSRSINSWRLKNKLIEERVKENKCEICGISEWNGKDISFQLHHKNGNSKDNSLENLQILCPNCHSQTDNYAGKSNRRDNKKISKNRLLTKEERSLVNSHPNIKCRRVVRPPYEIFKAEFSRLNNNFSAMARKYGVSDNAIRKWIKSYEKYGI